MKQKFGPSREELLKEYEFCQTHAQSLESTIWQTGIAMGIGGIGPLIVMANHPMSEQPPWLVAAVVGVGLFLVSFVWGLTARRWWSIQHACFMRMRHIETELGLFQTRYVQYLDDPQSLTNSDLREEYSDEIQDRAKEGKWPMYVHQSTGIQGVFLFGLPAIILLTWAFYVCSLLLDP